MGQWKAGKKGIIKVLFYQNSTIHNYVIINNKI